MLTILAERTILLRTGSRIRMTLGPVVKSPQLID